MIVLFSDFGLQGPYIGQVKAVLAQQAPGVPVIDLFSNAPAFDPQLSAYLLAAYVDGFPPGTVFLAVVDPGVGSARPCVALKADGRWFVGPGNGLFEMVARRAEDVSWWVLEKVPESASATFHGRDVFAPAAAAVAGGSQFAPDWTAAKPDGGYEDWPDELAKIVYVDGFGNAMTGVRASSMADEATVTAGGRRLQKAHTFSTVPPGASLWYENSNGLVEIAVNQGNASQVLGLRLGTDVTIDGI